MKEKEFLFNTALRNEFIEVIQTCYEQRGKSIDYDWLCKQSDATIYAIYKRETTPKKEESSLQVTIDDIQDEIELNAVIQDYFNGEFDLPTKEDYQNPYNLYNEDHQVDYNGSFDINGRRLSDIEAMERQEKMSLRFKR